MCYTPDGDIDLLNRYEGIPCGAAGAGDVFTAALAIGLFENRAAFDAARQPPWR